MQNPKIDVMIPARAEVEVHDLGTVAQMRISGSDPKVHVNCSFQVGGLSLSSGAEITLWFCDPAVARRVAKALAGEAA